MAQLLSGQKSALEALLRASECGTAKVRTLSLWHPASNPQVTGEAQVYLEFMPYYPMCLFSCCSTEQCVLTGLFQ